MVDINTIYKSNSDYIKAEDIGDEMWTVTILAADTKDFDNGDRKVVLSFHEFDKVMPLNVTNARSVGDLYGTNTDGWLNKPIMLFTMPVTYEGKTVRGIRIRGVPQQQRQPVQNVRQMPQSAPRPVVQQQSFQRPIQNAPVYDDRNPPPAEDNPFA